MCLVEKGEKLLKKIIFFTFTMLFFLGVLQPTAFAENERTGWEFPFLGTGKGT